MAAPTVILDNGAYHVKIGLASDKDPRHIPNCISKSKSERRKQFIGNQIEDCRDLSALYYMLPFQKGYLVNWDVQRQVWDYMFGKELLGLECPDTTAVVTEPYFNFSSIQEAMNEIFFEEYQFKALLRINAGTLSAHKRKSENPEHRCCLIVDSGYSFTHIAPYYNSQKVAEAIFRVNVGGKLLTNHLKEIISYRQLHVMDETYVMNQVKEDVCYVSSQFYKDMEIAKLKGKENTVCREYVLPDFHTVKRGFVKEDGSKQKPNEQIVRMNNERFAVPEILFHPSDISIQEKGISEAIVHSISATPKEMHPHLYRNIVLTGGNCAFPGVKERVEKDVRSLAPVEYDVQVTLPPNPVTYAWEGGKTMTESKEFSKLTVSKKQYEEEGQNICFDKFDV
ncbi:actin-related protein 6 [Strongylocentrotus purpuratus]|uniref:Actin-related protein 6 n=1 Tax=Strongylocentrotus purpuratus TaxID=7668 RepID=A0A7M7TGP6_STRPU|nr:actin-related protein 6 [Strongylocentrotus purpuratus]|eukprot:XP_788458.3 PREDICTED: actin-related protein 6 [Strongylocentrotus purpuratus]